MRAHNYFSQVMKKVAIIFIALPLAVTPANAFTVYSTMAEMFDGSEFMVTGVISESTLIMDPKTFFTCGRLLTIKDPIFHWRDGTKSERPSSVTIAYSNVMNPQNEDVGKKALILGNILDLSNPSVEKPALFEPFTIKKPYTGEEITIDCSALYPSSIKYEAFIKFNITTYQLISQVDSLEGNNTELNTVEILSYRLGHLRHPRFTGKIRGWKTYSGKTTLCLTDEICQYEVDQRQMSGTITKDGTFVNGTAPLRYRYLIDPSTLVKLYYTHNSK